MKFISKKTSLIILGLTSLFFTRAMLWFINDPEGPNLLIVTVLAAVIFALTLFVHSRKLFSSTPPLKKLFLIILVQIGLVTGLYFGLTELPKLPFEKDSKQANLY